MILNVKYILFLNPQLQYRIKDTISGLNIVLKRNKSMMPTVKIVHQSHVEQFY